MPADRASVRVAILRPNGPHSESEQHLFEAAQLKLERIYEDTESHLVEWRSIDPDFDASLVISQDQAVGDLACAYFTGPERVGLATRLVPVISYLPIELMHLSARASSVSAERRGALVVLGQFYMAEDGNSYWDTDIEETVRVARSDADPMVRVDAAFAEVKGNPAAASRHIAEALRKEADPVALERLQIALSLAEKAGEGPRPVQQTYPGALHLTSEHLALPVYSVESVDGVVRRFAGNTQVVARRSITIDTKVVAELVELKAHQLDATMRYATSVESKIGCAYFSGTERVVAAWGASHGLKYLPVHLAKEAAVLGRYDELRTMGILALAFASSQRMCPGIATDPELPGILARCAEDADPAVRFAAVTSRILLREELGDPAHHKTGGQHPEGE